MCQGGNKNKLQRASLTGKAVVLKTTEHSLFRVRIPGPLPGKGVPEKFMGRWCSWLTFRIFNPEIAGSIPARPMEIP
jgi:hypothetical protein